MVNEAPSLPPDPGLLNLQPKWVKPVLYICIGASALFVLFAIALLRAVPSIRGRPAPGNPEKVEAISNARQIGIYLLEFDSKFGAFPNASTIPLVEKHHGTSIKLSGVSSNALFRQLFAAQLGCSEAMFYANTKHSKKPDDITIPGKILEKGEVSFAYNVGHSSVDDPFTPIVLTPLIPGTTRFDPKPFGGKAVILHIDHSARVYDIHKDGHVYDKGIDILSPKHPVWKGKTPDIRYPE